MTVALVVASGIAGFIPSLSTVDSLVLARDRYYAADRFADVIASVKRAPNALAASLRDIPGQAEHLSQQFQIFFMIVNQKNRGIEEVGGTYNRRCPEKNGPSIAK